MGFWVILTVVARLISGQIFVIKEGEMNYDIGHKHQIGKTPSHMYIQIKLLIHNQECLIVGRTSSDIQHNHFEEKVDYISVNTTNHIKINK